VRSLDTCYCYFPAAAEVPVVVVVVVDTVADIVVAAAAAAALDRWTRTAPSPTSTEAPSTSSTSPPSAAPARRNLKRKTEEEERERERERARSPSAAVAAVAALLPSSRQEAIKAEALTSSPEEEVPVDCTVVAAVVDSLHPRREDWYYTRLVEIAAPSSEVGERLCLFIHQRKGDQNGGTKEEMLCQQAVRAHIFVREEDRALKPDREREKRREKRDAASKIEIVFPGLTHRKSFAAAAAAAEAEAARHRTKKGEVGTRSFEKRLPLTFFFVRVAFFFRRREKKEEREREREREKARALIIERIGNWTLNELENS